VNIVTVGAQPYGTQNDGFMPGLPCRIVVEGELSERFEGALEGLSLRCHPGYTELSGTVADRSQLQSLLNRLFDLGLQLLSVRTGHECADLDRSSGSS
jgi:hypothetical protein